MELIKKMNEVNETLRCIREEISYHKSRIDSLDRTGKFIDNCVGITDEHKNNILESIGLKMDFHNHKISGLVDAREELMKKYNIPEYD